MHSPRRFLLHCLFWRTNGYPREVKINAMGVIQNKKRLSLSDQLFLLLLKGWVWGLDQRVKLIHLTKQRIMEGPSGSRERRILLERSGKRY